MGYLAKTNVLRTAMGYRVGVGFTEVIGHLLDILEQHGQRGRKRQISSQLFKKCFVLVATILWKIKPIIL